MTRSDSLVLLCLALVACAGDDVALQPPEIQYGMDECSYCRMIISQPAYAAAAARPGEVARFDDIGCLLAFLDGDQTSEWNSWVHDHDSEEWLLAQSSSLVESSNLTTPMASGFVAFADVDRAAALASQTEGSLYGWDELALRQTAAP